MRVVRQPVRYNSPLVNSYLNNFADVAPLFEHDPGNLQSFVARHEVIMRDYHTDRDELVRVLKEYNESLNCGNATSENLTKLAKPETVVVMTGQQAGVLTGPLYTIYKTITTIQLAREISAKTGREVIPMFWIAAEDHDYSEIDHLDIVSIDQELVRLKLDYTPGGKYSVGDLPVTDSVYSLIEQVNSSTNPSEWKDSILEKLRELARDNNNLAEWFGEIMSWLFTKFGLVMINPLNRDLRRLWSSIFEKFLLKTDEINEKLRVGMDRVRDLGVEPQVEKEKDNVNLFLYVNKERLPLIKTGDLFSVRGSKLKWTREELLMLAKNSPELLSPNVVLRPVAQDALLPIIAYVAGPGEISYYALYREIYPLFDQRMPIIYPRVNATIIERRIAKNLDRYGIGIDGGAEGLKERLSEFLDGQDQVGIDSLFDKYREEMEINFRELADKVALIDPDLIKHGTEVLNKMFHQLEHFNKKAHQYHRKSCDTAIKRFRDMENHLFPRNNWQERVLNIFPYLFKYGPQFIDTLTETPLLCEKGHAIIYLGE